MEIRTLQEVIISHSGRRDRKIGFISGAGQETWLSYEALYTGALVYLYYLQQQGLCPGDELVLQIDNQQTFLLFFWAGILGGIRIVPLSVAANEGQKQKLKQVWQCLHNPYLATTTTLFEKLGTAFPEGRLLLQKTRHYIPDKACIMRYNRMISPLYNFLPALPARLRA